MSKKTWYILVDDKTYGPFKAKEIAEKINKKRVPKTILVSRPGGMEWVEARKVREIGYHIWTKGKIGCAAVIVLAIASLFFIPSAKQEPTTTFHPPQTVIAKAGLLCNTRDTLEVANDALLNNNREWLKQNLLLNKVVPLLPGIKVHVLHYGFSVSKITVLKGEYIGETGFVNSDLLATK